MQRLRAPNFPDLEDVEGAIEYYYVQKRKSQHAISKFLGLSQQQVRRALLRRDIDIRRGTRYATFTDSDGARVRCCRSCRETKPLTENYWNHDKYAAAGFKYICKNCRGSRGDSSDPQ